MSRFMAYDLPKPCWAEDGGEHVTAVRWIVDLDAMPRKGSLVVVYWPEDMTASMFGRVVQRPNPVHRLRVECRGPERRVQSVRWRSDDSCHAVAVVKQVLRRL